jgi:DNA-binding response OmpR family regulator
MLFSLAFPARVATRFDMTPTILCVDDDAGMARMMRDTLCPRGFKVINATTVREAVEVARSTKLDLIILDVFLPGEEGFALFERLADEVPGRKIPVIMASGCGTPEARNLASRRGAVAYLQKPFQIQQLLKIVNWAAPEPEPQVNA